MRITIIRDDGVVGVAGIFRPVDLSALPAGIRAVQWNGTSGHEYDSAANTALDSITDFMPFIERWTTAASQSSMPPALPSGNQTTMPALAPIDAACQVAIDVMSADYPAGEDA